MPNSCSRRSICKVCGREHQWFADFCSPECHEALKQRSGSKDLDKLEALFAAATPGVWTLDEKRDHLPTELLNYGIHSWAEGGCTPAKATLENAHLIVAMQATLPALLRELRDLRARPECKHVFTLDAPGLGPICQSCGAECPPGRKPPVKEETHPLPKHVTEGIKEEDITAEDRALVANFYQDACHVEWCEYDELMLTYIATRSRLNGMRVKSSGSLASEMQPYWLDGNVLALPPEGAAVDSEVKVCWCWFCLDAPEQGLLNPTATRMILCPDCGNKRCPKASHHAQACTNSNAPRQKGSIYGDYDFSLAVLPEEALAEKTCTHFDGTDPWGPSDRGWICSICEPERIAGTPESMIPKPFDRTDLDDRKPWVRNKPIYRHAVTVYVDTLERSSKKVMAAVQDSLDQHTGMTQPDGVVEFEAATAVGAHRYRPEPT